MKKIFKFLLLYFKKFSVNLHINFSYFKIILIMLSTLLFLIDKYKNEYMFDLAILEIDIKMN